MTILIGIIFSDIVPLKERGLWQGGLNVLSTIGMSVGAPLGMHPLLPFLLYFAFLWLLHFCIEKLFHAKIHLSNDRWRTCGSRGLEMVRYQETNSLPDYSMSLSHTM